MVNLKVFKTISVAMAPFAKARPRVTSNGTFMPDKYMTARRMLQVLYMEQGGKLNVEGMVYLRLGFVFAMPKSWSKKRKAATIGKWCLKKPDLDNCMGAVMDAILDNDSHVAYLIGWKEWGYEDCISVSIHAEPAWEYIPF